MAVPRGQRFEVAFDEVFPQGLYLVGEITPVTEYQSPEDKARNRPVRARTDEVSGLPLFRGTFADPPAAVPGVPFRPVVLEGLTVQPRAEASGQAKWITWVVRATGMRPVGTATTNTPAGAGRSGSGSASAQGEQKAA